MGHRLTCRSVPRFAAAVDLCQNPLTKQPKLERAKEIPEWETYDREVDEFARRLIERSDEQVEVVTGSAEALVPDDSASMTDHDDKQHLHAGQRIVDDL